MNILCHISVNAISAQKLYTFLIIMIVLSLSVETAVAGTPPDMQIFSVSPRYLPYRNLNQELLSIDTESLYFAIGGEELADPGGADDQNKDPRFQVRFVPLDSVSRNPLPPNPGVGSTDNFIVKYTASTVRGDSDGTIRSRPRTGLTVLGTLAQRPYSDPAATGRELTPIGPHCVVAEWDGRVTWNPPTIPGSGDGPCNEDHIISFVDTVSTPMSIQFPASQEWSIVREYIDVLLGIETARRAIGDEIVVFPQYRTNEGTSGAAQGTVYYDFVVIGTPNHPNIDLHLHAAEYIKASIEDGHAAESLETMFPGNDEILGQVVFFIDNKEYRVDDSAADKKADQNFVLEDYVIAIIAVGGALAVCVLIGLIVRHRKKKIWPQPAEESVMKSASTVDGVDGVSMQSMGQSMGQSSSTPQQAMSPQYSQQQYIQPHPQSPQLVPNQDQPQHPMSPTGTTLHMSNLSLGINSVAMANNNSTNNHSQMPIPGSLMAQGNSNMVQSDGINITVDCPGVGLIRRGKVLGQGQFGKVFLGINVDTGVNIAFKEMHLPPSQDENGEHRRAVKHEVDVMKGLQHPHIVSYLGWHDDTSRNTVSIFIEYVSGGSILDMMRNMGGSLSEAFANKITNQTLQGVEFLHKNNILHRDLKPANIMLDGVGCVKLADFGTLYKGMDGTVTSGTMAAGTLTGTPAYMAPEAISEATTRKSDIWSVGATVAHMATGILPWSQVSVENPHQLMFQIAMGQKEIQYGKEGFSDNYLAFMKRVLSRDKDARPSATEALLLPWFSEPPEASLSQSVPGHQSPPVQQLNNDPGLTTTVPAQFGAMAAGQRTPLDPSTPSPDIPALSPTPQEKTQTHVDKKDE